MSAAASKAGRRGRVRSRIAFAAVLGLFVTLAQANAGVTFIFGTTIKGDPPNGTNGWNFESEAATPIEATCNANNTAHQPITAAIPGDTLLTALNFETFTLPAGEQISTVEVDILGGTDAGTGNSGFVMRAAGLQSPSVVWNEDVLSCQWRFSGSLGGNGWTVPVPSGGWTAAKVNGMVVGVRRAGTGNHDLRVNGFRIAVTTIPLPPATPTGLQITSVTPSSIGLSWTPGVGGGALTNVQVERAVGSPANGYAVVATLAGNATSYTDPSLSEHTTYFYRVRAFNGTGVSAYSNEVGQQTKNTLHNLSFTAQPTSGVAGQALTEFTVEAHDANGNLVPDATASVTLTLKNQSCGAATLSGTTTLTFDGVSGVLHFTGLSVDVACTNYVLFATPTPAAPAPFTPGGFFTILPASPDHVTLIAAPSSVTAGVNFAPQLSLEVRDALQNRVTNATVNVCLTTQSGPSGGQLIPDPACVMTSTGSVEFPSVVIQKAGTYTLTASGVGLPGGTASIGPLTVQPGMPNHLTHTGGPGDGSVGNALDPITFELRDAFENLTTATSPPISIALVPGSPAARLTGVTSVSPVAGVATFSGLQLDKAHVGYQFVASATGLGTAQTTSFNVVEYLAGAGNWLASFQGFDDPDVTCRTRSWTGTDLSTQVFGHVSPRFLVNAGAVLMGTRAFWFGADSTNAASEVRDWVYRSGAGNNWSQRLMSPLLSLTSNPNMTLQFVGTVGLDASGLPAATTTGNKFLAVQGLRADGTWAFLNTRWTPVGGGTFTATAIRGNGVFTAQTLLNTDGNNALGLAANTRLRIVAQTDSSGSAEDGLLSPGAGPAQVDNLTFVNVAPAPAVVNFEDGTTGTWTPSAQNGPIVAPGSNLNATRDLASPAGTLVQPVTGTSLGETEDASCLWSFLTAGGIAADGGYAHLVSPWIALPPGAATTVIGFSGRLNTLSQRRALKLHVRGKTAGATRTTFLARANSWFTDGTAGDDASTLFERTHEVVFPGDFTIPGAAACDSIQLVFEFADRAELSAAGFTGRAATKLPLLDDIYVTCVGMDSDNDGIPNPLDACAGADASGRDANADGCVDARATFVDREYWAQSAGPIRYRMSAAGVPAITNGSDLNAIRAAFATWQAVPGASLSVTEEAADAATTASAVDGVNRITFEDPTMDGESVWDNATLALTTRTVFTKRATFLDQPVLPGQIVDADIRFNPNKVWCTGSVTCPPEGFDLQSIATHEVGHFLGLAHSPVTTATMYPVPPPGTIAATLALDDRAALSSLFPAATLTTDFATVRGKLTSGAAQPPLAGSPIAGALVMAVRESAGAPVDTVACDFTDTAGNYVLQRLPAGSYWVLVRPTDGFERAYIHDELARLPAPSFLAEGWNTGESFNDANAVTAFPLVAGQTILNRDLITDRDVVPPTVVRAFPLQGSTVPVDAPVVVEFSEPVDANSIAASFQLHLVGGTGTIGLNGALLDPGDRYVAIPSAPLQPNANYEIQVTTALTDISGVHLVSPFVQTFHTEAAQSSPVALRVSPSPLVPGAVATVTGAQFDATAANNTITLSNCTGCGAIPVLSAAPRWLTFQVPPAALSGTLTVSKSGQPGNALAVTVRSGFQALAPKADPSPVTIAGLEASDVVVSPDGHYVFAAGDGGVAVIDLVNRSTPVEVRTQFAGARHIALSADTSRLLVTLPAEGKVVELKTTRDGINYLGVLATYNTGGSPDGIAVAPNGLRAYVTDPARTSVLELDCDASGASWGSVLREWVKPDLALDGGLRVHPNGTRLVLSTSTRGLVDLALDASRTVTERGSSSSSTGNTPVLAIASSGDRAFLAGAADALIVSTGSTPPYAHSTLTLSGRSRAVTIAPDEQSALVAMGRTNQLAILDLRAGTLGAPLAVVATPGAPTAVARDANGTVAAVAVPGLSRIALYSLTTASTATDVVPPAAAPGEMIAVLGQGSSYTAGTTASLGLGSATATQAVGSAASFVTPANVPQTTTVQLTPPAGAPSAALPFTVLDALGTTAVRALGVVWPPVSENCAGPTTGFAPLRFVRSGPRGDVLARVLGSVTVGVCAFPPTVEFLRADENGGPLGAVLARVPLSAGWVPLDAAFSADGRKLWVVGHSGPAGTGRVEVLDCNSTSNTFGLAASFTPASMGRATAVAMDPLGRHIAVGSDPEHRVTFLNPAGAVLDSLDMGTHRPLRLTSARDGLRLWIGGEDRLWAVNSATFNVSASTPVRAGHPVSQLTVSNDGQRVFGFTDGGSLGVWSALTATLGNELSFAPILPASDSLRELQPAADGRSALARIAGRDSLAELHWSGSAPVATLHALPAAATAWARSMDGRRMWMAASGGDRDPVPAGDPLTMLSLAPSAQLALVQGNRQVGAAGSTLPNAVRVRVQRDDGTPVVGALVRFSLASAAMGQLDNAAAGASVDHLSDASGFASVTWKLPASGATVTMQALDPASGVSVQATAALQLNAAATAPSIVATGPIAAAQVSAGSRFFIRFDQPMDSASVASHLTVTVSGNTVAGRYSVADGGNTMVFTPERLLAFGAAGQLILAAGALDADGQQAPGLTVPFTTATDPGFTVAFLQPASGQEGSIVNVVGTGFSTQLNQNVVTFNGRPGILRKADPELLEVVVPAGATSGPVVVTTPGHTHTGTPTYTVLASAAPAAVANAPVTAAPGGRELVMSTDGTLAYVVNPANDNVDVFDVRPGQQRRIRTIAVGHRPVAIALHPSGAYAYVANSASNDVTVFGTEPQVTSEFLKLVTTIPVGHAPTGLATTSAPDLGGDILLVVNSGDATLYTVDIGKKSSFKNGILRASSTGSTATSVVIVQNGGHCWLSTPLGAKRLNLGSGQVDREVSVRGGLGSIDLDRQNGRLLYGVTGEGNLVAVDAADDSPTLGSVLAEVKPPSRGSAVRSHPAGSMVYVSSEESGKTYGYRITGGFVPTSPGAAASPQPLVVGLIAETTVGTSPQGIAVSPDGAFAMVVNEGSDFMSQLTLDLSLPTPLIMRLPLEEFDLANFSRFAVARIEPFPGFFPNDITLASVRLGGILAPDSAASPAPFDGDQNGLLERPAAFDRDQLSAIVPTGAQVFVSATGRMGPKLFVARDTLRVRRGAIMEPEAGRLVPSGRTRRVFYDPTPDTSAATVALLQSLNAGRTWTLVASGFPNTGSVPWAAPASELDSVRLAVIQVDTVLSGSKVRGVLGMSGYFKVTANVGVEDVLPARPELRLASANPARSDVRLRFGLPVRGGVEVQVFDVQGRLTRDLAHGAFAEGWHDLRWDRRDRTGARVRSGLYFVRLRAAGREELRRVVLLD